MKALIIHSAVHSTFSDTAFTSAQIKALSTWNNGNPAPDAMVIVPQEWESFVNNTFTWTLEAGLIEPEVGYVLGKVKDVKLTEFDFLFSRVDAHKIRPVAGIAEAVSAGESVPTGDAYRLSELEAIAEENRRLRDLVIAAETIAAVNAISTWWPEGAGSL